MDDTTVSPAISSVAAWIQPATPAGFLDRERTLAHAEL